MKNKSFRFTSILSVVFFITSCSLFETKYFDWLVATKNNTLINYALLIGQNEHSDSIERTRSTREALDTRDPESEINGNANLGTPKQGRINLGGDFTYQGKNYHTEDKFFEINEVEHMEQKSLAGVTWDTITANSTTATWLCKHGKNLTMIVSNNDGMAEGATMASNWIQGLPTFGYDANNSTLKLIKNGRIMGTVDQNASAQAASAYMLIRNILDDQNDEGSKDISKIGTVQYNPTWKGFNGLGSAVYGAYINGWDTGDIEGLDNPETDSRYEGKETGWNMKLNGNGPHEILSRSFAIDTSNIDDYFNEQTGQIKTAEDLAWTYFNAPSEPLPRPLNRKYRICHVYNNIAEVYLQGNMHDYFAIYGGDNITKKTGVLDLDIQKIDGDGIDETTIFNKITSANQATPFDAFLINMVTTTDGSTFISNLAEKAVLNEKRSGGLPPNGWDKWEERLDTPVVFWNKQPQTVDGKVDTNVMNNRFFKYTYYVGVDASYGGKQQGQMIIDNLKLRYFQSIGVIKNDA